jgi:hypothetical protein
VFSPGLANPEPFRNEILKNPRVLDFTSARMDPSYIGEGGPHKLSDGRELVFYRATGDSHFLDFSPDYPSDERESLIINETAAAIALPVAFLAGRSWLNRFAYRIEMGVVPFAAAACFLGSLLL